MYLEINNLTKNYGSKQVLDNINIDLEKGKFLCQIFLDGKDITYLEASQRKVSTVFQSLGLFSHMTIFNNVMYGLKFNQKSLTTNEKKKLAHKTIEMVGLKGYEKRKPGELSGGERQRVALARSLVVNPKLLLMDEPFSALDQKLREKMQIDIRKIHKDFNLTTIFVTHDQGEAFKMADEVIVLNEGKIIDQGSPQRIYNKPSNIETLDFIGQKNILGNSFIRPEKIKISENGEEFIIKDIIFMGSTIEVFLANNNKNLKLLLLNDNFDKKIGDKIKLDYDMEQIK